MVKIRLRRFGKKNTPVYRVVVADGRSPRDGRIIEEIGTYDPLLKNNNFTLNLDRVDYWLGVGAQPTDQVRAILKLTGDWGRHQGDKDAVSTVKTAETKAAFEVDADKKSVIKPKVEKKAEEPAADAAEDAAASDESAEA